MMSAEFHGQLVWLQFFLAVPTVIALIFLSAPYGRHERSGWGPTMPARWGWIMMESPAVLYFGFIFWNTPHRLQAVPLVFFAMWQLHYINRTFVFPFLLRGSDKRMPVVVALMAILFNLLNATINAHWIGEFGRYSNAWLTDPRFIVGALLFLVGFMGNIHADSLLRALRKPGESGYKIPQGGLYRWISCPNYFFEILEWTGWAIATWSTAGLAFAIYTAANLAPRAASHHRWYQERFEDYPKDRKALVPLVW